MNATQNIPVSDSGHLLSHETNRRIASQARSEFLYEGMVYICQSIRRALEKSIGALPNAARRPVSEA